jgi:hypothetical protein
MGSLEGAEGAGTWASGVFSGAGLRSALQPVTINRPIIKTMTRTAGFSTLFKSTLLSSTAIISNFSKVIPGVYLRGSLKPAAGGL